VKSGVAAVLLFDVQRLWHRRKLAQANARPVGRTVTPLQQSRVEATRRNATLRSDQGHPEIYRIGRDYLGPAFTCFVYHIIKECERIGADDIYYFAREGRLFQNIHEILVDHMECLKPIPLVRLHYLYVSRLATSLPAIREIGQRELHLALYRDPNATLRQCIEAFGLAADDVAHLDFALDDRAESTKAALFAQPEFKSRVSMRAAMARAQLRRYLAQEEFFQPEEVKIFVDIGWNATIQANLAQAFHDDAKFPMALGYYFGRKYRHEDYVVSSRSLYMPGVFFDQMRPAGPEYAIGHCLELFELAAAAPHGATLGYREAEHHVTPVLNAGHAALSNEQLLLQSGIVDFAQRFARSYTSGVDIEWLKAETVDRLAQLILRPTLKQAEALRCLHHSLDWGSEKTRPLIAPNMGPRLFLKPARFIEALSNSYWLEGCVRVTRVPGAFSLLKLARWSKRLLEVARRMRRASGNLFAS
jgi:predicted HAD superfamily hydrolase